MNLVTVGAGPHLPDHELQAERPFCGRCWCRSPLDSVLSRVRPRLQLPLCSGGPPCVWSPSTCSRRPRELAPCELMRSRTQRRVGNGAQGGRWAARLGPPALLLTRRGPPHLPHRDAVGGGEGALPLLCLFSGSSCSVLGLSSFSLSQRGLQRPMGQGAGKPGPRAHPGAMARQA